MANKNDKPKSVAYHKEMICEGRKSMIQNDINYSIIVPVYNVKEYLAECIESLVNQTYQAYEIILVDDGSMDGSADLCDMYAQKYSYVKVFHKTNGGLSDARNYGIDRVSGEYMIFVDSDDYIDTNTLLTYFQSCKKNDYPDILIDQSNYSFCNGNIRSYNNYDYKMFGKKTGKDAFMAVATGGPLWSPCAKCYKVAYWRKEGFRFTKGIYAEDLDLIYKVIYLADSVVMTPIMYYYREKRDGSISNTITEKKFMDVFTIINGWELFFEKYKIAQEARDGMYFYFAEIIVYFIMGNLFLINRDERNEVCRKLEDYRYVYKKYHGMLGTVTNLSIKLIGIRNTSFLLFYMKRICLKFMKRR